MAIIGNFHETKEMKEVIVYYDLPQTSHSNLELCRPLSCLWQFIIKLTKFGFSGCDIQCLCWLSWSWTWWKYWSFFFLHASFSFCWRCRESIPNFLWQEKIYYRDVQEVSLLNLVWASLGEQVAMWEHASPNPAMHVQWAHIITVPLFSAATHGISGVDKNACECLTLPVTTNKCTTVFNTAGGHIAHPAS